MNDSVEIKDIVCRILNDIGFPVNDVKDGDANLMEYGMDSLTFMTFVVEIEDVFSIEIPDEMLSLEALSSLNGFITYLTSIIHSKEILH